MKHSHKHRAEPPTSRGSSIVAMAGKRFGSGKFTSLPAWIAASVAIALAAPAAASAAPSVTAGGAGVSAVPQGSHDLAAVEDFWTPARIEAAPPVEEALDPLAAPAPEAPSATLDPVPFSTSGGIGSPELFASSAKGKILTNPTTYPNRVHGKLVGAFDGVGTFGCSATVVSSGSQSLLVSAGHCAYDPSAGFARNLAFAPGYSRDSTPYGVWPVTNVIVPNGWARGTRLDYDVSMMRVARSSEGVGLQEAVGSRGIAFDQPRRQRMQAYGYPVKGSKQYDGTKLVRCGSGYFKDPARNGGPLSVGIRCDMKQGSSGGGWVAQETFLVSDTSHGYPEYSKTKMFGPYFGAAVRSLYTASQNGWPSVKPASCHGQAATIVGTDGDDRITGTKGKDVIAGLGGNDAISGGKGKDLICGGEGDDTIKGNADNDRLDGGPGYDNCNGGAGRNKFKNCEIRRG